LVLIVTVPTQNT